MSTQYSQNKNTTKKIKLDKVDKNVSSIAEFKRLAILKYCNGNVDIKSKKNRKITKIITAISYTKLSLNKNAVNTFCKILKEKLQIKNSASVYLFVNLFNLTSLKNSTLSYIERCFTIVSNNESFLELEYKLICKILASSELLVSSEIEVFKVANRWLNHNIEERSKYAEDLLLKVRLHLLSTETIRYLLNNSTFMKIDGCMKFLKKMLECLENGFCKSSNNYNTTRYCNQKYFKLLVCGGHNLDMSLLFRNVSCVDVNKVGDVEAYPQMVTGRIFPEVVYLKGDIYVFGGWNVNDRWIKSIEKYSFTSKTWNQVAEMNDDRNCFCVCAFIDKIFVIGGRKEWGRTNTCLQLDTSGYSWKKVATMNEPRSNLACAIFEERIVVSGGWSINGYPSKSVERYDVLPNKWSTMPSMNSFKYDHSLVVVKNKLFVISKKKDNCEVYDNICKKFITIKSPQIYSGYSIRAFSTKSKIFALQDHFQKIIFYDTDKNEWLEEPCEVTRNLTRFSSVKVPCL